MALFLTMIRARDLYRAGNNAGYGYALEGATVDEAAALSGGVVVLERRTSDDVAVVDVGGQLVAIGGDAMGRNPWAVDIQVTL